MSTLIVACGGKVVEGDRRFVRAVAMTRHTFSGARPHATDDFLQDCPRVLGLDGETPSAIP